MREEVVYISGPMSGYKDFNYPAFFSAEAKMREKGFITINPANLAGSSITKTWEDNLRVDIAELTKADSIVMLDGWENSKGALLELFVALKLGMRVYEFSSMEVISQRLRPVFTMHLDSEAV